MITVTYDPAVYKMVPVDPTLKMLYACAAEYDTLNKLNYAAMLAAVPADLPGVVAHSWEPAAKIDDTGHMQFLRYDLKIGDKLFTHPPAQPDTEALSDQDAFEVWANSHGGMSLERAGSCETIQGLSPATYWTDRTEIAWRAWANKPKANTEALQARIAELEAQLETERMRLAGCGVAALSNTPGTVAQRIARDNSYWSASYGDVCSAVDREMDLREKLIARNAQLAAQEGQEPCEWHAPGMGEVHSSDHKYMIECMVEIDHPDQDYIASNELADQVAKALNAVPSASANALAIVQAALEAAMKVVYDTKDRSGINADGQSWLQRAGRSDFLNAIRAIDPKSILLSV